MSRARGFSLIEVMMATVLLAAGLALAFTALRNTTRATGAAEAGFGRSSPPGVRRVAAATVGGTDSSRAARAIRDGAAAAGFWRCSPHVVLRVAAATLGHADSSRAARAFIGGGTRNDAGRLVVTSVRRGTPAIDAGLNVVPDSRRNLLLLSGPQDVLESALDALNIFDVDVLSGKSVALVRLTSGEPEAVVEQAQALFDTEEGGALRGVVEFVPNERLGSVLVVSSRAAYLDRAVRWIRELDRPGPGAEVVFGGPSSVHRMALPVPITVCAARLHRIRSALYSIR